MCRLSDFLLHERLIGSCLELCYKLLLGRKLSLVSSPRYTIYTYINLYDFMPRSQRNDNFIDKEAFIYYRDGMSAQAEGEYAEALQNYYQAMRLEVDPYDRSYIFYNIGLIHTSNGEHTKALEYYYQALDRNPALPQALNNIAVIYHYRGEQALESGNIPDSETLFGKAAEYWKEAIRLAPLNYSEAQNWLQTTGR